MPKKGPATSELRNGMEEREERKGRNAAGKLERWALSRDLGSGEAM